MISIAGLVLYTFLCNIVVSGKDLHCQLTSNIGKDSVLINLHQILVLNCSTIQENNNNLTFEWKRCDHQLKNVASVINITNVKWDHVGNYECIIKGGPVDEFCNITVKVKAKPDVEIGAYSELHRTMHLDCFIRGCLKPEKITWYKNAKQIFPNETDYFVKNGMSSDGFRFVSTLQKHYPALADTGNYSCEARNEYGTSRSYGYVRKNMIAELIFNKCPEFKNTSKEVDITVVAGTSATLSCEVINVPVQKYSPLLIIVKMINNTTICNIGNDKNNYSLSKNCPDRIWSVNYTIVNADRNDSGRYVCRFLHADYYHCPINSLEKIFNIIVLVPAQINKRKVNLLMVIAVSASGALFGLGLVLYVRHLKRKLKSQFYDSCPNNCPELRWDVFVSYSSHDFSWVNDLCQMLEQPPFNLTVCLHQRDWELGRSVVDNMVDSVYCSQKTLIILSKNYVESEYCMQELQIALHSEMSSELASRKDRIILIKIDDVSMRSLPRILRQKSYLDCSDREHAKHFKTNLLRALPRRRAETQQEEMEEEGDQQSTDDSNSSDSSEMRLHELQMV